MDQKPSTGYWIGLSHSLVIHRIRIGCFSYNTGAERLYKRPGFVEEGKIRQEIWFEGEFYDRIELGMLEDEWRELRSEKRHAD
jgi:RimJ/RimL family protein N-acetyltransferase